MDQRGRRDHVDRLVDQWERLRPDFDPTPMEVVGRVFRASRFLEAELSRVFRRYGLSRGEFDVLASLLRAGSPNRLNPTELSDTLLMSNGAMTYRVDRLEAAKLVRRRPDPSDRRGTLVELTSRGRRLATEATAATLEAEARLVSGLSDRQRSGLAGHLRRLLIDLEGG